MGTQLTKKEYVERFAELLSAKRDSLANSLPATVDVEKFIDVAQTAILVNVDEMARCTQESLYLAVKKCAQVGLLPDGEESAIVRYGSTATWMPMVQGIVRLILRSPNVAKVETRAVLDGDVFEYEYGLAPKLVHVPRTRPSDKDYEPELTHAYAIVYWKGLPPEHATFEVVTREEVERARKTSRASDSGAWKKWYAQMARKVALHRIRKYVDLSPEAQMAIAADIAAGWEGGAEPLPVGVSIERKWAAKAENDTADLARRFEETKEPIEVEAEILDEEPVEDLSEGEREPTPDEEAKAEAGRRRNFWRLIDHMTSDDETPIDDDDVEEAVEKLFGGRDGIEREEGGAIVMGALSSDDLTKLLDELVETKDARLAKPGKGEA